MNIRIGPVSRVLTPFLSFCGRCRTTWAFVDEHSTTYKPGHGCFPLCEKCWRKLTPVERLPYYRELHNWWVTEAMMTGRRNEVPEIAADWPGIEQAVLAGG